MSCTYIPESHLLVLTQVPLLQNFTFTLQNRVKDLLMVDSYAVLALVNMALSWMGLASIPLCVTIKSKNLPELTLNAHFKGLIFMSYLRNNSKVSCKCLV